MVVKKYVKAKTNKMYGGSKRKTPKLKKSLAMRAVGWGTRTAALGARTKAFVNPKSSLKKLVPGGLDIAKKIKSLFHGKLVRKKKKILSQKEKNKQIEVIKNLLQTKVSAAAKFARNLKKHREGGPKTPTTVVAAFKAAEAAFKAAEAAALKTPAAAAPVKIPAAAPVKVEPLKSEAAPEKIPAAASPEKIPAEPLKPEAPPQTKTPTQTEAAAPSRAEKLAKIKNSRNAAKAKAKTAKAKKTPITKKTGATTKSSKTDSGPGILKRTAKTVRKGLGRAASAAKKGLGRAASAAKKGVVSAAKGASKLVTGAATITPVK